MSDGEDSSSVDLFCSNGREDESESVDSVGDSKPFFEAKSNGGGSINEVSAARDCESGNDFLIDDGTDDEFDGIVSIEDCNFSASSGSDDTDDDDCVATAEGFDCCNGWSGGVDGADSINDLATDDNSDSGSDLSIGGDGDGVADADEDSDDETGDNNIGDDSVEDNLDCDGDIGDVGDDGGDCWGGGGGDNSFSTFEGGCNNVCGKSSWMIDLLLGLPVLMSSLSV